MDTARAGNWSACAQFPPSLCRYRRFRAVLAVLMFNEHTDNNLGQDTIARCMASGILRRAIRISARPDELAVLTDNPHRLVQKVLPRDVGSTVHGIPGLRCLDADPVGLNDPAVC